MMITQRWLHRAVMLGAIMLLAQHVYAQETQAQDIRQPGGIGFSVGIKGGGSIVRLPFSYAEDRFSPATETDYRSNLGVQVGVFAELDFGFVSVRPEILYSRQGGRTVQSRSSAAFTREDAYTIHYALDYIQVPLLAKFRTSFGLLGYIGPQMGYLLHAKTIRERRANSIIGAYENTIVGGGTMIEVFELDNNGMFEVDDRGVPEVIEESIMDYFDVLDLSLVIGGGYEFSNGLGIDIRYSLGFFDPISEGMRVSHVGARGENGEPIIRNGQSVFEAAAPLELVTEVAPLGPLDEIIITSHAYRPDAHDQVSARNHVFQLSMSYTFKLK